ncbi:HTH_48 domain-containing protein [Trichonephila clavipes]|nr:HTH_48 domain-containing protein [Trichonephila clavipes]
MLNARLQACMHSVTQVPNVTLWCRVPCLLHLLCQLRGRSILAVDDARVAIQWYHIRAQFETDLVISQAKFKNGQTDVHDEEKNGRPSIVTDELVAKVDETIRENRRFTITELSLSFPQVSRTLLFENVTQKLTYRKFCARWVPKLCAYRPP